MSFKRFKDWPENLNIGQYLQVGDVVDKEMYEHFLNILPPHYYFGGMLQVGGVCDHIEDNGFLKPTYLTFVGDRDSDNWIFKGECFSGEVINRNPELEPPIEKFRQSILAQLKKQGFDVSQIDLSVEQFIDDEHKNCLWYGGVVATVEYCEHVFWLEALGDISATLLDLDYSEVLCDVKDKYNSGRFYEEMSYYIKNDKDLGCLVDEDRLVFNNNNWFEIFVETPDGVKHDLMDVCNSDDLDDCILEMIDSMDELIEYVSKDSVAMLIDNAKSRVEDAQFDEYIEKEME